MSNDWDVYCVTCDERMGITDANHCDDQMRALAKLVPALAQMRDSVRYDDIQVNVAYGKHVDLEWCQKHRDHDVRARDEYGAIDRDCNADVKCGECTSRYRCRLPQGHDGTHSHKARNVG